MDEITVNRDDFPVDQPVAHVNKRRCDGCGFCVDVCPAGALSIVPSRSRPGKRVVFLLPKSCHGCGACQATCPEEAIYIPSLSPADLRRYINRALAEVLPGEGRGGGRKQGRRREAGG